MEDNWFGQSPKLILNQDDEQIIDSQTESMPSSMISIIDETPDY